MVTIIHKAMHSKLVQLRIANKWVKSVSILTTTYKEQFCELNHRHLMAKIWHKYTCTKTLQILKTLATITKY